jgi:hypothetical protein
VKSNVEGLGTSEETMSQPRVTEAEIVENVVIANAKAAAIDATRENESEFSHTAEESGEAPIIPKKRTVMYKCYFLLLQQWAPLLVGTKFHHHHHVHEGLGVFPVP